MGYFALEYISGKLLALPQSTQMGIVGRKLMQVNP